MQHNYPFLDNKYKRWHDAIVERARERAMPEGYVERHHVIPRCLGGNNNVRNIVTLTAREHYLIHFLLTKMTKGRDRRKMLHALGMMGTHRNKRRLTSHQYETARRAHAEAHRGMKFTLEARHKMSQAHLGKPKGPRSKDHRRKISEALRGKILTDEHRLKLSKALIGNKRMLGKKLSKDTRRKISNAQRGRIRSKEHRKKLSEALRGQSHPKVSCIYCRKITSVPNHFQHHGERCKESHAFKTF